jgi:hypothetical protein
MVATGWLLDVPFGQWTYELVDNVLQARVPEDEHIEYKETFVRDLQDALVAMSNGDGGYVFVGVGEVSGQNIPRNWPLLDPSGNHLVTVYNKAGSERSPPVVRPRARAFTEPGSRKQVVVIRVDPGSNPPYFAKNRGVFVRVGERDTHADPRALEALFARRQGIQTARQAHAEAFTQRLGDRSANVVLHVYLAPLYETARLRYVETPSHQIRRILEGEVSGLSTVERRSDEAVHFSKQGDNPLLTLLREGRMHFIREFPDPPGALAPVPMWELFRSVWKTLCMRPRSCSVLTGSGQAEVASGLPGGRRQAAPAKVLASRTNVSAASRARSGGGRSRPAPPWPVLATTWPRRIAWASSIPSSSRWPLAMGWSPRIGRSRSVMGAGARAIGLVVSPRARGRPGRMRRARQVRRRTARR